MLLNSKKSQETTEVQNTSLKCFLKMAKRELAPGRWRMKGDETRPRGWDYPTPPCALAKILPEPNVCAYFSQIENDSPTPNTFLTYIHNKYSLSLYVYARGILGCLLGFWPLGQNPAGAKTTKKRHRDTSK